MLDAAGDSTDSNRLSSLSRSSSKTISTVGSSAGGPHEWYARWPGERRRKTEPRPVHVDRARLAVVLAEHARPGALLRRQGTVDAGGLLRHLLPAEPVGEKLRQRPHPMGLDGRRRHAERPRVAHVGFRGQKRERHRREDESADHEDRRVCRSDPCEAPRKNAFRGDAARGEQHRIGRGQVVDAAVHRQERSQDDEVDDAERAVALAVASEEEPRETADPERGGERVQHEHLLPEKRERRELDVAPVLPDRLLQLEEREAFPDVPDEVGQEHEEGRGRSDPDPAAPEERAAARGGEETDDDARAEEAHRVLVQQADAGEQAERQPQARIGAVEEARDEDRAARPDQRLPRIHGREAVRDEHDRRDGDPEGREKLRAAVVHRGRGQGGPRSRTSAAPARAGSSRIAKSESPSVARTAAVSAGWNGGMSM